MLEPHQREPTVPPPEDRPDALAVRPAESVEAPQPATSWWGRLLAVAGVLVSIFYLGNFGIGVFEFAPDNLPGVGNLDEALFTFILLASLRKLGIDLLPFWRNGRQEK